MRNFLSLSSVAALSFFLSACGSTTKPLPQYERPLAKTEFQSVKTTAYTHTEGDHIEYGNKNALGGTLRAAAPSYRSAAVEVRRAEPADDATGIAEAVSYGGAKLQPFTLPSARATDASVRRMPAYASPSAQGYGSAAADWARWPAGTIFRLLSTGQTYQVDDYGWALAGRNTIDLYMATRGDMNRWGARGEEIQVLHWGDPEESLRFLQPHQGYRHIKRMVLELEGHERAAAHLD